MSEMTVSERLAAVRCDAAPFGWGPNTKGGRQITHFHQCSGGYSVGEVDCGYGLLWAIRWGTHGHEMDAYETKEGSMSLVPLPAPTPDKYDSPFGPLAKRANELESELQQALKTIAKQSTEVERLTSEGRELRKELTQRGVELQGWKSQATDAIAERNAAIDIARRMRDCLNNAFKTLVDSQLVAEFDAKYGPTPAPSNQKSFGQSIIEALEGYAEEVKAGNPAYLPITEPLDPIDDPANTLKAYRVRGSEAVHMFTLSAQVTQGGKTYRQIATLWVDESTIEPWTGGAQ